ncbi:hypothetical protein AVEN_265431-1 [Araneus ventricosus]|uniref:Uncharacterized protein n=1 Tax=Araneus ventricosus TaxID=182803 RepID=A0A4Y2R7J3_ARAVE|nr:hypothetical protein AVEN_265431-1 [Araneus ventricosus]
MFCCLVAKLHSASEHAKSICQMNKFKLMVTINSLNPARVRIPVTKKLKQILAHENRMKSFLSLQKFQEGDIEVWTIMFQQRKEPLFSHKIHSGDRNRLSPTSVEWGGFRRNRAHRVKDEERTGRPSVTT